ncbi:hypothetical protein EDD52_101400 [Primorskyibacter sedentarius]|uniref:Uncharacterized protein n=1 Tax=Primorskyibacter sedentarius TaxID=745311 RepID=A0A4R3JPL2_9RHOB|nr:DUF6476 family protein [Primorskyibacter sedentarius]TCS67305.1 hypothetical protein EDD52_101400 [Primorskyibacter sedentarius]
MDDAPKPVEVFEEPANLKFLRMLVTILTGTMIAGLIIIIALVVIRYSDRTAPLPDTITLPDGATATAFTQGPDWYAVVTADDRILIFDRATGKLINTVGIRPTP